MVLNFPNTPSSGDEYTGPNGVTYTYDGVKWVGQGNAVAYGSSSITNNGNTVQVTGDGDLMLPVGGTIIDGNGDEILFSGNYNDLTNKPTIPTNTNQLTNGAGFISSTNTLVNGIHNFTLANTGDLTFPDNLRFYNDPTIDTSIFQKSLTSEGNDTVGSRVYLNYNEVGLEQYLDPDGANNTNSARVQVSGGGVRLEISQDIVGGSVYSRLDLAPTGMALSSTDGITTSTFLFDGNTIVLPNDGIIQQRHSYVRTTNGSISPATSTIVWTGLLDTISSVKLNIQVEGNETGDTTGWHSQACEAIIASRGYADAGAGVGDPQMTVYGVIHTSADPLVTFTVQRNVSNIIEVVATPTATADQTTSLYTKIYSVEMLTRD